MNADKEIMENLLNTVKGGIPWNRRLSSRSIRCAISLPTLDKSRKQKPAGIAPRGLLPVCRPLP